MAVDAGDTADVVAIQQLYARYGWVMDDQEWSGLDDVFTADAVFDATAMGLPVMKGTDEIRQAFAWAVHPLAHHLTDVLVERVAEGSADVRARVIGVYTKGRAFSGSYRDQLVRTDAGWRIRHRLATPREAGRTAVPADRPSPTG